jgi:mitochondrial intermembrane space import and assembly protein 40
LKKYDESDRIVAISRLDESIHHIQESNLPTLEALAAEKRERQAERQVREARAVQAAQAVQAIDDESEGPSSVEGLEEEADQQGAFNPETGEINWDCPCLGGMAHGPCGEEFKAAFSCFVYSKEEPKGMECIDKFK